jgi:hypothetical protein
MMMIKTFVNPRATTSSPDHAAAWSYDTAFRRNRGLISSAEQDKLRNSRVAIAGLGSVGGVHLVTLARLGIGPCNVADPDRFELANFGGTPGNRDHAAQSRGVVTGATASARPRRSASLVGPKSSPLSSVNATRADALDRLDPRERVRTAARTTLAGEKFNVLHRMSPRPNKESSDQAEASQAESILR